MTKLAAVLGLSMVLSCGGGGNGGTGGDFHLHHAGDFDEFLDEYLGVLCDLSLECESKQPFYVFIEILACHPDAYDQLVPGVLDQVQAAIDSGRVVWNEEEANTCLEALSSVATCSPDLGPVFEEACSHLFSGTVPAGGDCVEAVECVSGRCDLDAACPGTCVALAGAGEVCAVDDDCDRGLRCGDALTCEPYSAADGECRSGSDCPSGACSNGTCEPLGEQGDACDHDLFSTGCAGSLVCSGGSDTEPGTCGPGARAGSACGQYQPCATGLRCVNDVCATLSGPGDACQDDFNCPGGFYCDSTCRPLPFAGDACSADRPCLTGVCDTGTCRLLAAGETCDPSRGDFLSFRECAGWCETDDVTGDSACAPLGQAGATCSSDTQCGTGLECTYDSGAPDETCTEKCGW